MKPRPALACSSHWNTAFSLVETALALGIVGFALIGIVGALPLAMNNERLSIAQSRAASVAQTIFANFREQPFNAVSYLDDASATINLDARTPSSATDTSDALSYYAYYDEVSLAGSTTDARRLHFVSTAPSGATVYHVLLRFSTDTSQAPLLGMLPPYYASPTPPSSTTSPPKYAEGNSIEMSIYELDRPKDIFRFSSVIANRREIPN